MLLSTARLRHGQFDRIATFLRQTAGISPLQAGAVETVSSVISSVASTPRVSSTTALSLALAPHLHFRRIPGRFSSGTISHTVYWWNLVE